VSKEGDILQGINSDPDPHGRASNPRIYSPDLQGWSWTPRYIVRTPRLVPDLHVGKLDLWNGIRTPLYGSGLPIVGSQGPRTECTWALNRTQAGVRYRHVSRPSQVWTYPHTLLLPAQAETRCYHVAYCA
jgi:hypothetical protein